MNEQKYHCNVCGDPVSKEWASNGIIDSDGFHSLNIVICPKKSCWEKFLPMDLVKKYLTTKSRYDLLKEKNSQLPPVKTGGL